MAKFRAVEVRKMEELEKAVKEKNAVILLTNKNISDKVKKISDHDVQAQKKSDNLIKTGGVSVALGAGLFVVAFFCAEAIAIPMVVVSAVSFMTSGVTMALGTGKKILNAITTELKDYKWYEVKGKKDVLVLYKYRGINTFNPDKDELE